MNIDPKLANLYFFNDQYDDMIVKETMHELYNRSLDHALKTQPLAQRNRQISGWMKDFTVNKTLNKKYKLPETTYTCTINENIVPWYNEKVYIDKYAFNKPLSLMNIIKDKQTFNSRIKFRIHSYVFLNLRLVCMRDNKTILCIDIGMNEGITQDDMNILLEANHIWTLMFENQSDVYYAYLSKTSLFKGDLIPLSKFSDFVSFYKQDMINMWSIYISSSLSSPHLLTQSDCKYVEKDGLGYFEVSSRFKAYINSLAGNCRVYVIHDYYKTGFEEFIVEKHSNSAVNQIPYINNPISPSNTSLYTYMNSDDRKIEFLETNMRFEYPNLYKYDVFFKPDDVSYQMSYYEAQNTMVNYDDEIKEYLEFKGETYLQDYRNFNLPDVITNHRPLFDWKYDYDDYRLSAQYGDVRQYNLAKLKLLLDDNKSRYHILQEKIDEKNKQYINAAVSEVDIDELSNRSILDTSTLVLSPEDVYHFDKPQTYIEFSNPKDISRTAAVYIDGKRIIPTLVLTVNYKTFVFIDQDLITSTTDIVIDIPKLDRGVSSNKATGMITFGAVDTKVPFPIPERFGEVSGNNLVFFNYVTKEYIPNDQFTIGMMVDKYYLEHLQNDKEEIYGTDGTIYLLTNAMEFYMTDSVEKIMLQEDSVYIPLENSSFNKRILSNKLLISTSNPNLVNIDIGISNTDQYRVGKVKDLSTQKTFTMDNFREYPNIQRFRIFNGGRLISTDDITITMPKTYGDSVVFDLASLTPHGDNSEVIIEYLSSGEREGLIDSSMVRGANGHLFVSESSKLYPYIMVLNEGYAYNIKKLKIFINGLRVSPKNIIKHIGLNQFSIINHTDGMSAESDINIKAYLPLRDETPYRIAIDNDPMINILTQRVSNTKEELDFQGYLLRKYVDPNIPNPMIIVE